MSFQYLKINQVAKMFSVSRDTIVKWIKDGLLSAVVTPGGHYRVLSEEVEKLRETIKFNPNA